MINVTSQYAAQTFLSPATSQITTQINGVNSTSIRSLLFPRVYSRTSFAGVAPDGSLAKMYQFDALINPVAEYAYPTVNLAQRMVQEAAASVGNEYYIEAAVTPQYYSILTWASNI